MATLLFWNAGRAPDVLLSEDGRAIAIRTDSDQLAMMYPRRNKFIRDIWLRAYSNDKPGTLISANTASRKTGNTNIIKNICNKNICTATTLQGARVYVIYDPKLLAKGCNEADILLAPRLRWVNCYERQPALIIKRGQLEEFGSHGIYLDKLSSKEITAQMKIQKSEVPTVSKRIESSPLQLEMVLKTEIPESYKFDRMKIPTKTEVASQIETSNDIGYKATTGPRRLYKITKVTTSIKNTNRPWNIHRKGRAEFLQD